MHPLMKGNRMSFQAELLKKKLKSEGKTRNALAVALKKHPRTVSRWLAGTNSPKSHDLEAIAQFLNCNPQDFDPFFANEDLGEISIHAHISTASHNAYEMMSYRYGVTQKQIIELAPVLFSIVAGYALKVPEQDDEIAHLASLHGMNDPRLLGSHLEDRAAKQKKCFGIEALNPQYETSRNLFNLAIVRLSSKISEYVDTKWFGNNQTGESPKASGFVTDVEMIQILSGGQEELAEAIVKGRVRLSSIFEKLIAEKGVNVPLEEITENIKNTHTQSIEIQRKEGLKKLSAWREFYSSSYPELSKEFDDIVKNYCHKEGWYPEHYTNDDRIQSWVNPIKEDFHIDKSKIPEFNRNKEDYKKSGNIILNLPTSDPIYRRFFELQSHRSKIKDQFERIGL